MTVVLRDIRPEDKSLILRWRNSPEVARYMYTDHLITLEEHERWFQTILSDHKTRYWIITDNQKDVGLVYLYNIDQQHKRCYWGSYIASPASRGSGVGSITEYRIMHYVFEDLNFNRLCCEVLVSNMFAIEMHKKFGFVEEGYFREHVMKGGQHVDVISLAMLRKEWEANKLEIESQLQRKGLLCREGAWGKLVD